MTSFKSGKLTYAQQELKHKKQLIKEILAEQDGLRDGFTKKSLANKSEDELEKILSMIIRSKPLNYRGLPSDIRRAIEI